MLAGERGWAVSVRGGGTTAAAVAERRARARPVGAQRGRRRPWRAAVHVGGGTTWAQLDAATAEHRLAVPGARVSSLGVAGVALGAGSGWFERPLGATSEWVRGMTHVGGAAATAGAQAPTGGVVVELELALHPLGAELLCGFLGFPRERAAAAARGYRDAMADAPPEVGGGLLLHAGRGGACQIVYCFAGDVAEGERAVAPLRALRPTLDAVGINEHRAFQAAYDLHHPFGMRAAWRSGTFPALTDAILDAALDAANSRPRRSPYLLLRPLRDGWAYDCLGLWPPLPALDAGNEAWVDRAVAALG